MFITFLIPAGLTSRASINFKEESQIIKEDAHSSYLNHILPEKMKYNIEYIKKMNIFEDIKIIFLTAINIFN
jgi:lipopolysaccharide/colanic/teichoic acid biosynthesis glycosyltransferase